MVVFILGLLDILAACSFLFLKFGFMESFAVFFMFFLIIKGVLFIKNIVSILDIVCGVFLILAYFDVFNIVSWICFVWLLQKGVFSLFTS